jgi:hypothetical protein
VTFPETLRASSEEYRPISSLEYNDLVSLLKFLPKECHPFYRSLRHTNVATDITVEDDEG